MVETAGRTPARFGDDWWGSLTDPLRTMATKVADFFSPVAEASKDEDKYEVCIELPGVEEDNISVSVDHDTLMITGEKKSERHDEGKTYIFSEVSYGKFQRTFRLPGDADEDKISAAFNNGVLKILIAKKASESSRKEIPIHK
ncbi:MAG: Hsp20/alpha crystallin family protein [Magnetovibrio sp.]|nr:Hsp20/alpha crystallin family protein [Magnetovibrio sp.]